MMRKNKSQRLFQSLRSLRLRKNGTADEPVRSKSARIVLMDTHSVPKPVQYEQQQPKMEVQSTKRAAPQERLQEPTCYVRCPLGLEAGNTMMVISPCGTHKFPIKIPKGIECGQEFEVKLPHEQQQEQDHQTQQQEKQEGGLAYIFRVVDEFLTPTPSFEEDEPQQAEPVEKQQEPAPQASAINETKVVMSEDFGSALDSFFTPIPEVKAYFHAASA